MGWEDYYDDVASRPGDDDDDDDEGVESLASLRAQVALAAQRCKEINRLCVTELAKPDGAAETLKVNLALTGAGARGAGATILLGLSCKQTEIYHKDSRLHSTNFVKTNAPGDERCCRQ